MAFIVPIFAQENEVTLDTISVEGSGTGSVDGYVPKTTTVGTKTSTPLIEVPQSISVVTRKQMDVRNVQREGEAFRYTAGVFAEPNGGDPRPGFDTAYIRGFEVGSTSVYRDGLREIRGVWAGFMSEFYGLERADVLKGPTSVMYGQGSPGGIIDKITKKPLSENHREVVIQGGSFDRMQGSFDFSGPLDKDKNFLYRIVGLGRDSNTQFKYYSTNYIPDNRLYLAPSFTWAPTEKTKLTILSDVLHNYTASPFTLTYPATATNGYMPGVTNTLIGDPNFNRNQLTQYTIGYRFEHEFNDVFSLRQNMRYGALNFLYNNMTVCGTATTPSATCPYNSLSRFTRYSTGIDEHLNSLGLDTQLQANLHTGGIAHTALFGVDYLWATYNTRTRSNALTGIDLPPPLYWANPVYGQTIPEPSRVTTDSHQTSRQVGFYAQDQAKYENWILTASVRVDDFRSETTDNLTSIRTVQDNHQASFRGGITYVSEFGIAPYFSFAQSFQPVAGTDYYGAPFKPTTGHQFEGGVKFQPQNFNGLFTLAIFDLTQQNVTTLDPDRPATAYRVQTGEVNSRGIELEATTSPLPGLDMMAAFTHNPVQVTKDNPNAAGISNIGRRPVYIPKDMASLWADYTLQDGELRGFGVGAGVRFVGPTYADATNYLRNSAYTIMDATLHYDLGQLSPAMEGFRIQVNANNILNHQYYLCTALTNCQWALDRSIIGRLSYHW